MGREVRALVCGSPLWNDPEPIRLMLSGLKSENPEAPPCVCYDPSSSLGQLVASAVRMLDLRSALMESHDTLHEYEPHLVFAFLDEAMADVRTAQLLAEAREIGATIYVIGHDTD